MRLLGPALLLALVAACYAETKAEEPKQLTSDLDIERFNQKRKDQHESVRALREQLYATRVVSDKLYEELLKAIGVVNRAAFAEGKKGRYVWNVGKINMGHPVLENAVWALLENFAYVSELYSQMPKSMSVIDRSRPARQWLIRFGSEFCKNSGLFHPDDKLLSRPLSFLHPKVVKVTLRKLSEYVQKIYDNAGLEIKVTQATAQPYSGEMKKPNIALSVLSNHQSYERIDGTKEPNPTAAAAFENETDNADGEDQVEEGEVEQQADEAATEEQPAGAMAVPKKEEL